MRVLVVIPPSAEYHSPMKAPRPVLLTLLCVIGFISGFSGMFRVYSPEIIQVGKAYALFRYLGFALLIVCCGGLWNMHRWAVWSLAAYFILNQAVCWHYGLWDMGALGPLLILAPAAAYYRRMT